MLAERNEELDQYMKLNNVLIDGIPKLEKEKAQANKLSVCCERIFSAMLEVTCNDRLGKKVRVKCNGDDTIGDLKKLIAAQTGTRWDKIVLKKWYTIFKDHIKLQDWALKRICTFYGSTENPRTSWLYTVGFWDP
uniref:Ubiquitin-like protein 5 n=5 Tax=Timema TaxID=61471 RepID=A0A7R9EHY8_9NEOP|nr:unnamed protein product [Timema monikensis]